MRMGGRAIRKYAKSFTETKKNGARSAPPPITGESDYRGLYRKKRFPRRRKKTWVKFVHKVKSVIQKAVQPNFLVVALTVDMAATLNKQGAGWFTLHSINGDDQDNNDARRIFERAEGNLATLPVFNRRIVITGALMEVSMFNAGLTTAYLDCYYWRAKKDVPTEGTVAGAPGAAVGYSANNVADLIVAGYTQLSTNQPVGGSFLDLADYGVTPFQSPVFSRFCEVWKKVRIKMAVGGTAQLELRDGKDYWINWQYDANYLMKRNRTQGIFIVVYGVPSATGTLSAASTIQCAVNKNYTFKVIEDSTSSGGTNRA